MFISAYKKRQCNETITILDAAGAEVVLASTDQIRLKIGRAGETPVLDLSSNSASSNGSTVARANPCAVRLDQDDLDFSPGAYDVEVSVVDDSDGDAIKHANKGSFILHNTQLGSVSLN
mgnify:CR=1 FL=1|tara:strand:+ start:143 stop:499 length:357 start_codon:yes stop_codon:yes gene_type:complete